MVLCERRTLIRTMVILASLGVVLGISISISPFLIQHSASYVPRHEVDRVVELAGVYPLSISEDRFRKHLGSFEGCPRKIDNPDLTVLATVAMFDELGYPSRFHIDRRKLISFVLHVKEGYKDVPFHNWSHGFSAGHFAFLLTRELGLKSMLSDARAMGFLIGALCHDLGHPGTTSNFQKLTNSEIANRFQVPSLLEKYHLDWTRRVLEIFENDILENVSPEEKIEVNETIEQVILATDLVQHFDRVTEMANISKAGFNSSNTHHVSLVVHMLSTAFDLSDQTKDFDNVREVAYLVCKEFYAQGIRERSMGLTPDAWMDPERADVVVDQIKFIESVSRPLFEILHLIFPKSQGLVNCLSAMSTNLKKWYAFDTALNVRDIPRKGVPISILKDEQLLKMTDEIYHATEEGATSTDSTPADGSSS